MKTQVIYPTVETTNVCNAMNEYVRVNIKESKVVGEMLALLSALLEREVSFAQAMHLLHAQLAFLLLILFGGSGVLMMLTLLAWWLAATYQCWRALASN